MMSFLKPFIAFGLIFGGAFLAYKVCDFFEKAAIDDFVLTRWEFFKRKFMYVIGGAFAGAVLAGFILPEDNPNKNNQVTSDQTPLTEQVAPPAEAVSSPAENLPEIPPIPMEEPTPLKESHNRTYQTPAVAASQSEPVVQHSVTPTESNTVNDTGSDVNQSANDGKFKLKFKGPFGITVDKRYYPTEEMKKQAETLWESEGVILELDGSKTNPNSNQASQAAKGLIPGH